MKLSHLFTLVLLPMSTLAFNIFNGRSQTVALGIENPKSSDSLSGLKSNRLLVSKTPKPELYTKAMLELKRLEEEPLCHRMAAQLLMNTCRGIQDISEDTLKSTEASIRSIHVESFAAALTICDLEQVNGPVPEQCRPLGSAALHQAYSENRETLIVEPELVGDCIEALFNNDKNWATWLHRRNSGLLFCRAASLDMDKDQLFQSQKRLVQIMTEFASDLDRELRDLKDNMQTHVREADSYFESFMSHVENLGSKLQGSLGTVSDDVQNVASAMKHIRESGVDIQRFLKDVFHAAVQGNAEMAARQEQALAVTTDNVQVRLENVNEMAERTEAYALMLGKAMGDISQKIEVLAEQQMIMGQKSEAILVTLSNTTELFQAHTDQLEQANVAASRIHDSLGNVAAVTNVITKLTNDLNIGGSLGDWVIRLAGPPTAMLFGSYGLPPSLARNALLFISGELGSEFVVRFRHSSSWKWEWEWCSENFMLSAMTHLARKHIYAKPDQIPEEELSDLARKHLYAKADQAPEEDLSNRAEFDTLNAEMV
ncbi:hypothetical protein G7Y89_g427 [Cudoniella acicularis]|uniref:Nuclear fusion protein KAR5 n=1 Tax=Cudoniella acicularis TaxID=354080 RepID=A0A8H4W8C0_9HELO|nr:hypothetical protein G7Y89_g427 [Cudoniella acicularis]